jgi:carbonic anhydrase
VIGFEWMPVRVALNFFFQRGLVMVRRVIFYVLVSVFFVAALAFSVQPALAQNTKDSGAERGQADRVLSRGQQAALTPDAVLAELLEGNQRFVQDDLTTRNHSARVREAYAGQFPKAVVLSCLDSRIPVEDVFDRGVGDIFVARVAGNFVNEDILGSMEFGCHVAGAKLILVLGHTHCGAVVAAIDDVRLGNITAMLANIRPAIKESGDFAGKKSSANPEYVQAVCRQNIRRAVSQIRNRSTILAGMESKGEIKIIGAYYDLKTGTVSVVDE